MSEESSSGDGAFDLAVNTETVNEVSGSARSAVDQLAEALRELRYDPARIGRGGALESAAALERVRTSWEVRLTDVGTEGNRVSGTLATASTGFGDMEADITSDLRQSQAPLGGIR